MASRNETTILHGTAVSDERILPDRVWLHKSQIAIHKMCMAGLTVADGSGNDGTPFSASKR